MRLWNLADGTCDTTLSGHKSAITALRFNAAGALLASGSQDTDIIIWDAAAEAGLFRLRGHQDEVTDLVGGCSACMQAVMFPGRLLHLVAGKARQGIRRFFDAKQTLATVSCIELGCSRDCPLCHWVNALSQEASGAG